MLKVSSVNINHLLKATTNCMWFISSISELKKKLFFSKMKKGKLAAKTSTYLSWKYFFFFDK